MKIRNYILLIALLAIGVCFQQGFVLGQKIDEWAIEFDNEVDSIAFAERFGLIHQGQIGPLKNTYLFSKPTSEKRSADIDYESTHRRFLDMLELPQTLHHPKRSLTSLESATDEEIRDSIKWFQQQELKQRTKRSITEEPKFVVPPTDPLYPNQWHLSGNKSNSQVDINVLGAWKLGYTGKGVTIAIVDDGIDQDHPDMKPNFRQEGSYNFNANSNNTRPVNTGAHGDWHGTTSAGVAAARDDGQVCGVGVAPRAGLSAVVILQSGSVSDAVEARAITHALEVNDIYSNSWGPVDDGRRKEAPGPLTQKAFEHALKNGRNGLGTIYVWAAGNGRRNSDECNYDGYANWRGTVLIGAVSWKGSSVWYSESCAALLGVTPSSGDAARKDPDIFTTDLRTGGLDAGQCTSKFTGTSASCPMAAGIVALMLEANPNLSWLDVQYILVDSCVRTSLDDPDWKQNGAGRWVNHKFGFGLIDTTRAVELSTQHKDNTEEESRFFYSSETKTWDAQTPQTSATIVVPYDTMEMHHVEIRVNITHRMRGRLSIVLTAPSGLTSILANQHNDGAADYNSWRFTSLRHWGEEITGNWTLSITDTGLLSGELKDWSLTFYGLPHARKPRADPNIVIKDDPTIVTDRGIYSYLTTMSMFLMCVMAGLMYVYYRKRKVRSDPSGVVNIL